MGSDDRRDSADEGDGALARTVRSADGVAREPVAVEEPRVGDVLGGRYELLGELGRGGEGVVYRARDRTADVEVALKLLGHTGQSEQSLARFRRELRLARKVTDPRVVRIYDLVELPGRLGLSMELVVGEALSTRLARGPIEDPRALARLAHDLCRALAAAHEGGVTHRDLKPANVMLGEFGECYVLDWGIAVSLQDDGSGRIPLAKDAGDLAGTPSFLAPEMLDGHGRRLSARTDVYLLGGILYQILTGEPPHQGETFAELVTSVMTSRPSFPADAPAELVRICTRALDADPDARFETPEQLRLAITGYLSRRGATRLATEAERRLERLRAELARPDARARRLILYGLWSECAFGFREALAAWPGGAHDAARAGLARAAEAMVDYELAGNDARAAAALIADIDDVSTEVRARVGNALTAQEAEEARLARIKVEHDPRVGQATRGWLAIGMTLVWTLAPLIVALRPSGWETHRHMMTVPLGFLVLMVLLSIGTGGAMLKSGFNRSIALSAIMMTVAMLASHGITYKLGIPAKQTYVLHFFIWSLLGGMLAITLEWRFALPAVGYLIGTFIVAWHIDWVYWTMSATSAVLAGTVMWVWHPSGKKPCGPESPQASNF